ncbi:MAG: hypothetical protein ISQ14_07730 [Verrucomicrobiae bacterium]|jgi:ribosomal protein L21E|nr:hypothetical protein [Verrucomicrobiae bacterium]
MALSEPHDSDDQDNPAPRDEDVVIHPDFSGKPRLISELTGQPDFPRCALGVFVDIRGFTGVVVEIFGQSFRVVSEDGVKQRFNGNRLRSLLSPRDRAKPKAIAPRAQPRKVEKELPPARVHVEEPDFEQPVQAIGVYARQADFPKCAYGCHVEIPGFTGVVVEIVKDSVRVQSKAGSIRRFNGAALKRLYGMPE